MSSDLDFVVLYPDRCTHEVSRRGEAQPCDTPAVAARLDPEDNHAYPVCAYHARGRLVPLRRLLTARADAIDPKEKR